MKITASIVTYNNENEIGKALDSFRRANIDGLEMTVVDNASTDNTVAIVKQYPEVRLIESGENRGFGAGHNLAIQDLDSDYHIMVNPDITVEPGEVEKMLAYMEAHPDVSLMIPKLIGLDGEVQYTPKLNPTLKYMIGGRLEKYSKLAKKWRSEYTLRGIYINDAREVDLASGCFMVCRTSVLNAVGGFDERFFLYCEDFDLSRRMKQIGKVVYYPLAHVTHEWKRDNGKLGKGSIIAVQSIMKFWLKWR